ncbi:hypothetical protein MKW98_005753 [Papaver atlanticum]|uniref:Uncharacterized protein n=1 Tax=Papaver atlanticum TaxID=357466 RepID=A0AAD4RZW2_9MAGN|nr:hypothetical protein MKW98_005753 [Papaver atlanticum]
MSRGHFSKMDLSVLSTQIKTLWVHLDDENEGFCKIPTNKGNTEPPVLDFQKSGSLSRLFNRLVNLVTVSPASAGKEVLTEEKDEGNYSDEDEEESVYEGYFTEYSDEDEESVNEGCISDKFPYLLEPGALSEQPLLIVLLGENKIHFVLA